MRWKLANDRGVSDPSYPFTSLSPVQQCVGFLPVVVVVSSPIVPPAKAWVLRIMPAGKHAVKAGCMAVT